MAIMKITILGLEMALKPENKSVFDLMNLPTGIDKDALTDNIILEGGDFEDSVKALAGDEFSSDDIRTWCELLEIPLEESGLYFFA